MALKGNSRPLGSIIYQLLLIPCLAYTHSPAGCHRTHPQDGLTGQGRRQLRLLDIRLVHLRLAVLPLPATRQGGAAAVRSSAAAVWAGRAAAAAPVGRCEGRPCSATPVVSEEVYSLGCTASF